MGAFKAGCDRAREWISLALDDELSELEDAQLQRHLRRCAPCAGYAATLSAATGELRAAPPVPAVLHVPLERVRRGGGTRRLLVPLAAVLAVVAGTLGTTSVAQAPSSQTAKPPYFEKRLLTLARNASHREIDITS